MATLKLILLLALCSTTQPASSEFRDLRNLAYASNKFAFKLHKAFTPQGNAFTSPVSIFTALAMLYQGARGITAEELREVLSFSSPGVNGQTLAQNFEELLSLLDNPSQEYKVAVANAMVFQCGIEMLEEYKDTLRQKYKAALRKVDFEKENSKIVQEVNNWVKHKTRGKIRRLLNSVSKDTVLMLLNAVYFNGTWEKQFYEWGTREEIFYNDGVNGVPVQMMVVQDKFLYGDFDQYGVKAVKLPYKGGDISMLVVVPLDRNGLSKVEKEFNDTMLYDIVRNLRKENVDVKLPKFKLKEEKDLKENLTTLGMKSAFIDGANFGGIAREGKLKVSKVVHKAAVEVNEEGTEAVGITELQIKYLLSSPGIVCRKENLRIPSIVVCLPGRLLITGYVTLRVFSVYKLLRIARNKSESVR